MASEARYNCCPACGRRIDARRAIWNSEITAFRCKGCNTRLVKKTATVWLGMGAFVAWYPIKHTYGWDGWQTWAAIAFILGGIAAIALVRTRVRLATADDPDRMFPAKEAVPDKPPPPETTFRGASGPPPAPSAVKDSSGD